MKKLLLIFVLLSCEPDYECIICYNINTPSGSRTEFCGTAYECKLFKDEIERNRGWVCP